MKRKIVLLFSVLLVSVAFAIAAFGAKTTSCDPDCKKACEKELKAKCAVAKDDTKKFKCIDELHDAGKLTGSCQDYMNSHEH